MGDRGEALPLTHGRGDGATHPAARDPGRDPVLGREGVRDIYLLDLRLGSGIGIKVPT